MPPARELPEALGESFGTAEARSAGVTPRRLRARDLEAPFHGVRRRADRAGAHGTADPAHPFSRDATAQQHIRRHARAYAAVMDPHAFFADLTALALHAAAASEDPSLPRTIPLSVPTEAAAALDVAVFSPARAPRGRGIRGRRISPAFAHIAIVDGLRVATPASAWAMLAGRLSARQLIAVADALVRVPRDRRGMPHPEAALTTPKELRRASAVPRAGAALLRATCEDVRIGAASPLETDARLDIRDAGLPLPELDVEVRAPSGALLGITELAFPAWGIVVEIEGDHHRTDRRQWHRDLEKYALYAQHGIEVVRLGGHDVRTRRGVERVRSALLRRGWRPGTNAPLAPVAEASVVMIPLRARLA